MTLPAILPDWMPWWLQLLLWMAGVVVALGWVVMPFVVLGLRGRLAYANEQLDEVQAQLRLVAQRMPEPISAARYEALRASLAQAAQAPAASVSRGAPDDAAYRMPARPVAEPAPFVPPREVAPEPPPGPPPPPTQAFRPVLPPRAPLERPPAPPRYRVEELDDGSADHEGDYQRRLSSPFRSSGPSGGPDPRNEPRHEPRLRWPPRES